MSKESVIEEAPGFEPAEVSEWKDTVMAAIDDAVTTVNLAADPTGDTEVLSSIDLADDAVEALIRSGALKLSDR